MWNRTKKTVGLKRGYSRNVYWRGVVFDTNEQDVNLDFERSATKRQIGVGGRSMVSRWPNANKTVFGMSAAVVALRESKAGPCTAQLYSIHWLWL